MKRTESIPLRSVLLRQCMSTPASLMGVEGTVGFVAVVPSLWSLGPTWLCGVTDRALQLLGSASSYGSHPPQALRTR
jgi:hypothetical protein